MQYSHLNQDIRNNATNRTRQLIKISIYILLHILDTINKRDMKNQSRSGYLKQYYGHRTYSSVLEDNHYLNTEFIGHFERYFSSPWTLPSATTSLRFHIIMYEILSNVIINSVIEFPVN